MRDPGRSVLKTWLVLLGMGIPALAWGQTQSAAPATATSAPASAVSTSIPFITPHTGVFTTPSAPDAWGGPRTSSDKTLSDEVTSYTIDASLDPDKHTVDASETMTWRNRSKRPVRKVYFHLYLNAFENPGSTWFTERRKFAGGHARGGAHLKKGQWGYTELKQVEQDGHKVPWRFVHPDDGSKKDHTVVEFDLPKAVPPGGTMKLHIQFHDKLPRVVERTGWFGKFHMVGQWFPKIGVLELPGERGARHVRWNVHEFHFNSEFYADYGNYDVHLTVPKNYTVAAVGQQQGKPVVHGDQATWHFKQNDVEDFAWAAAPDYDYKSTTWTGPGSPEVTVKVMYPPEYKAVAKPILKATTDSLTYFSKTLGPYPYKTVTVVAPPYNAGEAGGMEYPTFFTAEGMKSVTPGTLSQFRIDFVTIHEFGHGYFMGILGSNEFEEPYLDEGMNRYWDDRMLADRGQKRHITTPFLKWLGIDPSVDDYVAGRVMGVLMYNFPSDPLDKNSWDRMSNLSYGSVYMRSATAMRTLENLIGHKAMGRGMKLYYQRWKFRHPDAADLRDALAEGTGRPKVVHKIFSGQVFGTRRVDDRVVSVHSVQLKPRAGSYVKDGKRVARTQGKVDETIATARKKWDKKHPKDEHGGPYPWRSYVTVQHDGAALPTSLKVTFADGSTRTVKWNDDSRWKRFHWDAPTKVVSAELDPKHENLLDANMLNNSYAVKADPAAHKRWTADAASLVESLYTFLVTL